jgi:predicted transcriptional regulator
MIDLLDRAVQTIRALPPATQDAFARILLELAGDDQSQLQLTAEEEASFDSSFAEAERGEFATDEEIRAIWTKHGL